MESNYKNHIIKAAITKLSSSKKPLSDLEITAGIVHNLKKSLGENDRRHTDKNRFRKDSFKIVINDPDWKKNIVQLSNKKYILKADEKIHSKKIESKNWNWKNIGYEDALQFKLNNLKEINPFKLEELVCTLLTQINPEFKFDVTKKTGDLGVDVIGKRKISTNKKEAIYVQVKRFNGTVSRDNADRFVGALSKEAEKHGYSRIKGLFVTTGSYSTTFIEKLKGEHDRTIKYEHWDGKELSRQMLKNGIGVKYSIDIDFWKDIDSTAILEQNNAKTKKVKAIKLKASPKKSKLKKQLKIHH
jgi:HJR/Mrr/RecB family endonuclease